MNVGKAVFIVGILWLAAFVWMFRFEVEGPGNQMAIHDRWTGETRNCILGACMLQHNE